MVTAGFICPHPLQAEWRNPKKHRHLRAYHPRVIFGVRCSDHAGNSTSTRGNEKRGQSGLSEEDADGPAAQRCPTIPVVTPTCPGEASRVLHPPRSSASGSSAKGRSATRSDSQRSHGRTRWDGHPAWGSILRLCSATPSGDARRQAKGERQPEGSDRRQSMWGTAA
jgi:hypothetical protein